jgi:hypothetical protein
MALGAALLTAAVLVHLVHRRRSAVEEPEVAESTDTTEASVTS